MDNLVELNDNFTVVHVLSEPTSDWTGPTGRIKEEILVDQVVSPSNSAFLCICGPLEFTNTAAQLAKNLGWNDRDVHLFKL